MSVTSGLSAVVVGIGPWSYVLTQEAVKSGIDIAGYVSELTSRAEDGRPVVDSLKVAAHEWSPDIAIVATRPGRTASMVCEALTNDLHVFAEKPLAISTAEFGNIKEKLRCSGKAVTVDYTITRQVMDLLAQAPDLHATQSTTEIVLNLPPRDHGVPLDLNWSVRWLPHVLSLAMVLGIDERGGMQDGDFFKWIAGASELTGYFASGARVALRCRDDIRVRNISIDERIRFDLPPIRGQLSPVARGMQEFRRRIHGSPVGKGDIEGRDLEVSEVVSLGIASWIRHRRGSASVSDPDLGL